MTLPLGLPVDPADQRDFNRKVATAVNQLRRRASNAGATADRPVNPETSTMFFDTTLGAPIWWNGSAWVWATGEAVP